MSREHIKAMTLIDPGDSGPGSALERLILFDTSGAPILLGGVTGISDVPGLSAALALLQASSTAATDAELASAVSTLQSAKQDASSAATDAELAAAVGTITTSLNSKMDGTLGATDAEVEAVRVVLAAADALKLPITQKSANGGIAALNASGEVLTASSIPLGRGVPDYVISLISGTTVATPRGGSGLSLISGAQPGAVIQAAIDALTVGGGGTGVAGGHIHIMRGNYFLERELIITGWEGNTLNQLSMLWISGEGMGTVLLQNTAGKNGIVIRNAARVAFTDFRMYSGSTAMSCIRADKLGVDQECSMTRSYWNNLHLDSGSAYPTLWLTNFFGLTCPRIIVQSSNNTAILLENDSTTTKYGNSHFGMISTSAGSNSGNAGLKISNAVNNQWINLITVDHYEQVDAAYYGIYTQGCKWIRFGFIDVEGSRYPLYIDGTAAGDSKESRFVHIDDGYVLSNIGVPITAVEYTGGCRGKLYVAGGYTGTPISDVSNYRILNEWDLNIENTAKIDSAYAGILSRTPVVMRTSSATFERRGVPATGYGGYQSGTAYTLADYNDFGRVVEMGSASASVVTIPTHATSPFPIGSVVEILQLGAGQVTVSPAAGVTLRTPGSKNKTVAQYSTIRLRKRDTNEWVLSGDLTT